MNYGRIILTIEATATATPRNAARINFHTQQRRVDFGRFLFGIVKKAKKHL